MTTPATYTSFLIRLWREPEGESESTADWHSEVRHIQSSRCWTFASLDETVEFLRRHMGGPEAAAWRPLSNGLGSEERRSMPEE